MAEGFVQAVLEAGDFDVADEFLTPDFVLYQSGKPRDRAGYKRFLAGLRAAFPDLRFTFDDVITSEDRAVFRWTAHGTHQGEMVNPAGRIPPTGAPVSFTGISVVRTVDGLAREYWAETDSMGLMQQLGMVPQPKRIEV